MSVLPTHIWTIILVLRDISWVTERTNAWDAVGVGAYGLLIALVESLFVFVIALGLGFLISKYWDEDTRVGLMSSLIFLVAVWAMLGQLYALSEYPVPEFIYGLLVNSARPLRNIYGLVFILGAISVVPIVYLLLNSKRTRKLVSDLIERLSLLAGLYLFFDVAAVIIILIRNF